MWLHWCPTWKNIWEVSFFLSNDRRETDGWIVVITTLTPDNCVNDLCCKYYRRAKNVLYVFTNWWSCEDRTRQFFAKYLTDRSYYRTQSTPDDMRWINNSQFALPKWVLLLSRHRAWVFNRWEVARKSPGWLDHNLWDALFHPMCPFVRRREAVLTVNHQGLCLWEMESRNRDLHWLVREVN